MLWRLAIPALAGLLVKMATVRHLEFKNSHIWSHDCHQVPNLHLYTVFHRNRVIFR